MFYTPGGKYPFITAQTLVLGIKTVLSNSIGELQHPSLIPTSFNFENTLSKVSGAEKEKFISFVRRMIKWNPGERSTAKELLEDPYLRQDE